MAFHRLVEFFFPCAVVISDDIKLKKQKKPKIYLEKRKWTKWKSATIQNKSFYRYSFESRARSVSKNHPYSWRERLNREKKTQIVSDYRHYFVRYYSCNNLLMWCIFFFLYSHVFWYRLIFWTNAAINGENWAPCLIYWFDFDRWFQISNFSKFVTHMMLERWNR